jgi:hypothetical protein
MPHPPYLLHVKLIRKLCEHWFGKKTVDGVLGWCMIGMRTICLMILLIQLYFYFSEGRDPVLPTWVQVIGFIFWAMFGVMFLIVGSMMRA